MGAPSHLGVDMPIEDGYVGMVDREDFDEWLRERAVATGAVRRTGEFREIERRADGIAVLVYRDDGTERRVAARAVIGADGMSRPPSLSSHSCVVRSAMHSPAIR